MPDDTEDGADAEGELRRQGERETSLALMRILNGRGDMMALIRDLAVLLREWAGCTAVGVRLEEDGEYPYYALSGIPARFSQVEAGLCRQDAAVTLPGGERQLLPCPCGNVLKGRQDAPLPFLTSRGSFWCNDCSALFDKLPEDQRAAWTCGRCRAQGFQSAAYIPLRHAGRTLGLLQLNDEAAGRFAPLLLQYLEELADQIAIAIAHRAALAALEKSEKRLKDISSASGQVIWETDAAGRLSFVSANVTRLFGIRRAALAGISPLADGFPLRIEHIDPLMVDCVQRGAPFNQMLCAARSPEGGLMLLRLAGVPVFNGAGAVEGWRGSALDVTERERIVEELDRREEEMRRLAQALSQAGDAVVITDAEDLIEYVNPAFERMTGFPAAEAKGRTCRELCGVSLPEQCRRQHAPAGGPGAADKVSARRRDGAPYMLETKVSPVRSASGRIERFVAVNRELSRDTESGELLQRRRHLESIGRLAVGVAQDQNNILTPILGYSEMLLASLQPQGKSHNQVKEIHKAAERSRDLVRGLLAFGRQQSLALGPVDLGALVLSMEPTARGVLGDGARLVMDVETVGLMVQADGSQLRQVLESLVVNAREALAESGAVRITARRAAAEDIAALERAGVTIPSPVILWVCDTGPAMSGDTQAHLFEPFYSPRGGGSSGLGLATAWGIVRQHGGAVVAQNGPGGGACLTVCLPGTADAAVGQPPDPHAGIRESGSPCA
jgi:PAS domain S-box-containing protein